MAIESILRRASLVLGTGYVLFFFSERMFWSMWRPGDEMIMHVLAWLLYSFFAYVILAAIRVFHVRDVWGLLLVGALFGWIDEGVYAMTLFGDPSMPFPLTIAWTSLAWHAPITVVLGWYGLRRALQAPNLCPGVVMSLGFGAFWGFWALGWSGETPPIVADPLEFFAHAAAATGALALSQWAITAGAPQLFRPSRIGLAVAVGLVMAFFGLVTVPAIPHAPLVVVPLFAILYVALRRDRARESDADILAAIAKPVRSRNATALVLIPVAATFVYSGLSVLGVSIPSHHVVAAVTIVAGSALFVAAVYRLTRRGGAWFGRRGQTELRGASK